MEFSPEIIREILNVDFYEAQFLMNEGKKEEAFRIFDSISYYFPEAEKVVEAFREKFRPQFDRASSLMDEGKYEEALYILDDIKVYYNEATSLSNACCMMLNRQMYNLQHKARSLMKEGKYEEALSMFEAVARINVYYSNHHESGYIYLDEEMEMMYWEAPYDLEECLAKLKGKGIHPEKSS